MAESNTEATEIPGFVQGDLGKDGVMRWPQRGFHTCRPIVPSFAKLPASSNGVWNMESSLTLSQVTELGGKSFFKMSEGDKGMDYREVCTGARRRGILLSEMRLHNDLARPHFGDLRICDSSASGCHYCDL